MHADLTCNITYDFMYDKPQDSMYSNIFKLYILKKNYLSYENPFTFSFINKLIKRNSVSSPYHSLQGYWDNHSSQLKVCFSIS